MWRWVKGLKGLRVEERWAPLIGLMVYWVAAPLFFAKVLARSEVPAELAQVQEIKRLNDQAISQQEILQQGRHSAQRAPSSPLALGPSSLLARHRRTLAL